MILSCLFCYIKKRRFHQETLLSPPPLNWFEQLHSATSRELMRKVAGSISELARILAGVLAGNLGCPEAFFAENCSENTCFLRLNRYPPCPLSPQTFGLVPHTDSDFLTILHQDHVGGLQLMKDSKWVSIKPNPEALIVNIGDLFQAFLCPPFLFFFS